MRRTTVLALLLVAMLTLATVAAAVMVPKSFGDEHEYWTLAHNVVTKGAYSLNGVKPSAFRAPGLPAVLLPLAALDAPFRAAQIAMVVFYALSGLLIILGMSRLDMPGGATLAALLLALGNPVYVYTASTLYPQVILVPLGLLILGLTIQREPALTTTDAFRYGAIGVLCGLAVLVAGNSLFLVVVIVAWVLLPHRRLDRSVLGARLVAAAAVALGCVVIVTPWVIRNAVSVHPGFYVSLNSGTTLLQGNNPLTTPTSGASPEVSRYVRSMEPPGADEYTSDRALTRVAVANVTSDPTHYATLYVEKVIYGLVASSETRTYGSSRWLDLILLVYYSVMWVGVALWAVLAWRSRHVLTAWLTEDQVTRVSAFLWISLAYFVVNLLGHAVFLARLRYRLPTDIPLAVVAGIALAVAARYLIARRNTRPV